MDNLNNLSLFDDPSVAQYQPPDDRCTMITGDVREVSGLTFFPQFITPGEERVLMWEADQEGEWSTKWSRRTKSFGSRYLPLGDDHRDSDLPLPNWATFVAERLVSNGFLPRLPNQMGINEYMPGQGIASHLDYFGGTVVSLSLGSGCVMDFIVPNSHRPPVSIWLPRCSIVVLKGEARNVWQHGIKPRKKDAVNGVAISRDRRISLTFRDVV